MSAQLRAIARNTAPGLLYVRITAGDRVLREGALSDSFTARTISESDVDLAQTWASEHRETVWVHIYDGDGGHCVSTIILEPDTG